MLSQMSSYLLFALLFTALVIALLKQLTLPEIPTHPQHRLAHSHADTLTDSFLIAHRKGKTGRARHDPREHGYSGYAWI